MNNIKIITLSDHSYFHFLKPMVYSCNLNFKQANMHVVLVNCSESEKEEIENMHDNITVIHEKIEFNSDQEKRGYCTNRRAYLINYLRNNSEDIVVWVDADSIFRKNCDSLYQHFNSCELTMRGRDHDIEDFAAGVIGLGNTPVCYDFSKRYYDMVKTNDRTWAVDQYKLKECYFEFKSKINFISLPYKYCDVWFSDDGVIWSAKSKNKVSKKYKKEVVKFMEK